MVGRELAFQSGTIQIRILAGSGILIPILGLEWGPLSLMGTIEYLLDMKISEMQLRKLKLMLC